MVTTYPYLPETYLEPLTGTIKAFYRPMIRIRISQNKGQISFPFDALVDSGSDRNLFPVYFAKKLRIIIDKNPKVIQGIGGVTVTAYPGKISIWIGTRKYETEADFSPEQKMPLLGRNGFFNLFKSIKFDEKNKFFYIEEYD